MPAVIRKGCALEYAGEAARNDKDIVMNAVRRNGCALKYAGETARNDKDIVMTAVKRDWRVLKYAGEEVRNDKEIVMEAVRQNGYALEYAGEAVRNDKEIVMEAVRQDCEALEYAGEAARNDKEIVMEAVKQDWIALQYAGETARNDKEIVMEAVKQNWLALQYAGEEAFMDKDIIMIAKSQNDFYINYFSPEKQVYIIKALKSEENDFGYEQVSETYDLDILNLASEGQLTVPEGYKVVDANIKEIDGKYKLTLVYDKQDNDKITDLAVDNERKIIYNTGEHLIWQSFKIDSNGDIDVFDNIFTNYQSLEKVVILTAENRICVLNFYINKAPVVATGTYGDEDIIFDAPGTPVNKVKKKVRYY